MVSKKKFKKIANIAFWLGYIPLTFGGVNNVFYLIRGDFQPNFSMGLLIFSWLAISVYAFIKEMKL